MNRYQIIVCLVVLGLWPFRLLKKDEATSCCYNQRDIVAKIGNNLIGKDEFTWRMSGLRTVCIDYFMQRYHTVYNDAGFWHKKVGHTSPIEWLKDSTLKLITAEKVKIAIMGQYGVLQGFDYKQLTEAFEKENTQRKTLVAKGQIIYGLQQFDLNNFYEYVMSNGLLETQRKIDEKYPPSQKEMFTYYEKVKKELFSIPPTVKVTYVVMHKTHRTSLAYAHLLRLAKSGSYKDLSKALTIKTFMDLVNQMNIEFSPASQRTDELKWGNVFHQGIAFKKSSSVSPVFDDEDGNTSFLLCRQLLINADQPLQEVRENVKKRLAVQKFESELAKALNSVSVKRCEATWLSINAE